MVLKVVHGKIVPDIKRLQLHRILTGLQSSVVEIRIAVLKESLSITQLPKEMSKKIELVRTNDPSPEVRKAAEEIALRRTQDDEGRAYKHINSLAASIGDLNTQSFHMAIKGLIAIKPLPEPVRIKLVPVVVQILTDNDFFKNMLGVELVAEHKLKDDAILAILRRFRDDPRTEHLLKQKAAETLMAIEKENPKDKC